MEILSFFFSLTAAKLPPPLLSLCCPKKADEWSKVFSDLPGFSECSVVLSVPLPALPWSEGAQAGLMEVLLEEWLLRPLQSLATVRPVAEFYRLKRKMMDSPFRRETVTVFPALGFWQGFYSDRVPLRQTELYWWPISLRWPLTVTSVSSRTPAPCCSPRTSAPTRHSRCCLTQTPRATF